MTTKIATIIFLLSFSVFTKAQSVERSMIKSFNLTGVDNIVLNLPGTVELKIWEDPTIRIEIKAELLSGNSGMLDELAKVGRYNLTQTTENGVLSIISPNTSKQIRIKGEELKEVLSYIVFVPKDYPVQVKGGDNVVALRK